MRIADKGNTANEQPMKNNKGTFNTKNETLIVKENRFYNPTSRI